MATWWEGLQLFEKIMFCIACPATLLLLIQTVLLLIGLGGEGGADGDADVDVDGDGIPDGADFDGDGQPDTFAGVDMDGDGVPDVWEHGDVVDPGLRLFSVRGLVAFFAVFSWSGLVFLHGGAAAWLSLVLALLCGVAAMTLVALILRGAMKLQSNGAQSLKNALGVSGTVYIPVPAKRDHRGKVNILLQGRLTECEAVTDDDEPLPTGTEIVVTAVSGRDSLVVRRK